jgi:hypothetical protein
MSTGYRYSFNAGTSLPVHVGAAERISDSADAVMGNHLDKQMVPSGSFDQTIQYSLFFDLGVVPST